MAMKHILNYSEWESGSGNWYCNDTTKLGTAASQWWTPAHMLGLSVPNFVTLLATEYKPDSIKLCGGTLIYYWKKENQQNCHKFVKFINAEAKKKGYLV